MYFLFSIIFSTSSCGILLHSKLFELYMNFIGNVLSKNHAKKFHCLYRISVFESSCESLFLSISCFLGEVLYENYKKI